MTQFSRLFERFADEHATIEYPGFSLLDVDGRVIGQLDRAGVRRGRYWVEGQATGQAITLHHGTSHATAPLGEVGGQTPVAFRLDLPVAFGAPRLTIVDGDDTIQIPLPEVTGAAQRAALRRQWLPFAQSLVTLVPPVLRWTLTKDRTARAQIKRGLGFAENVAQLALDGDVLGGEGAAVPSALSQTVSLILPVYNAFDLLPGVLDRLQKHTDVPWRLFVIEDCSTDPRVRPFLRSWAEAQNSDHPGQVVLIENPRNLGFVASVNEGFRQAIDFDGHVILLNSDAFVPAAWASRLLDPILTDPGVASVTPMSNDAEILSVPILGRASPLASDGVDQIDAVARRLGPPRDRPLLPTGVGFCMGMNIAFLRKVPQFDRVFGRGYGEEVDWCRATLALGGRHCCQPALFVEHRGASSFGSEERAQLLADNVQILSARYPDYDRAVQQFVRNDPLLTQRLALACAWAASAATDAVPIYLAHSMDGGAETYLQTRIQDEIARIGAVVILRVGGAERWVVELHCAAGMTRGATYDFAHVVRLLDPIQRRRVIYSCGVGDPLAHEIPAHLTGLLRTSSDSLEVLFHDFFPISPAQNLLDSKGRYCGVPPVDSADNAHHFKTPSGQRLSLSDWRAAWDPLLTRADELVVFSEDSRNHVLAAYPHHAAKTVLRPHSVPRLSGTFITPHERPVHPVIGVLGHIGMHKGGAVVSALSTRLAASRAAKLVVIGRLDPAFPKARTTTVHGRYQAEDIPALVRQYGITCWLVPSIWPETFSFTTHEALATGLPVYGFDIGAQAEALRAAPNGFVLPLSSGDLAASVLVEILGDRPNEPPSGNSEVLSQA
ncbi:glycosyltransferase [Pseudoruegeria sp. SK021]|uniref:glycosyltransferase n=1 Tax=Pseudoruegeria sp. SK021 TaxID=1933035 RepID=UPI000A21C4DD|nr:glycosyltransferase [Pseudoruegeria sp. SK021]OSP54360.1 hypothetical protein BV911_12820 [Pseudoruegeria sp. SK021]